MADVMTEDLQRRRWRLFLEQYASDYGDGWQSDLATARRDRERDAPFRGGAQSVDDYIGAAEMIVRADLVPPDGHEAANAASGSRIKLGE